MSGANLIIIQRLGLRLRLTLSCGLRPKLSHRVFYSVLGLKTFLSHRPKIYALKFFKRLKKPLRKLGCRQAKKNC